MNNNYQEQNKNCIKPYLWKRIRNISMQIMLNKSNFQIPWEV